jgi:hypothetical protein
MAVLTKLILCIICLFFSLRASAAERQLIFTYIGPVVGAGMNYVHYVERWSWDNFFSRNKNYASGYFLNGGITIHLMGRFSYNFEYIGDFSIQCMNNWNKKQIMHMYYTASVKFGFTFAEIISLAPGIGLYLETPPANRTYKGGGGVRVPLALFITTPLESKFYVEASFMYGWYGLGQKSSKIFFGISLGYISKVGKI